MMHGPINIRSNFMIILPLRAEYFTVDWQIEITKLIDAFGNSSNAPNNYSVPIYGPFPLTFKKMLGMEGKRVQTF